MSVHFSTEFMPGVYAPVFLPPAPRTRTRPAWLRARIVRRPVRRYRVIDARQLPY